ncbi:glycosyltransferase family 4 protein [Marinilongibacter aquaticus]|uniref:glycosyltransferase family 4 protein n=1 Tax=Marinilongibacter aquaticus TaxID=2975157 RepID=UPI0021BD5E79|nr:glycosyltransferase family 4 protein [Marinilongibacter aquaticus]UBM59733.1 glycosyltransferase family 4 protein [Marinilongibacter aquaticus]
MRILIVHQFLWAHYKAGIFKNLEQLVDESQGQDELHIIQTAIFEKARRDFGKADTSIHNYRYELLFDDVYENTGYWNRLKKVWARIRAFKPDVINLPGYYEPAMVTVQFMAKILLRKKIILSVDSTEGDNPNKWYGELLKRIIISLADGFFCYGKLSADYMLKLGAKEEQILMRRNSVNNDLVRKIHDDFKESTDYESEKRKLPKYNFIFVGRFLAIKNIRLLVETFLKLEKAEDWGLILVGDGPLREEIETFCQGNPSINSFPPTNWDGVPKRMALADVLVLPSYSEPWGLVTNEAMVCGKPVIVSQKAGSAHDLVKNGKNGFTFDAYSGDDLLEKLQFFVDNPAAVQSFGKNAEETIQEFAPEKVAEDMYNGFKRIIAA